MLTLYRLPRAYRALYVGITALLALAVWSHWLRLGLRHGWTPSAVTAWYAGNEAVMLFPKAPIEVADDAWMNLFDHTLAFLVMGGLLVRTAASAPFKAWLSVVMGLATLGSAAGPVLVWIGFPGAAVFYVATLGALSAGALVLLGLVTRDAWFRRSEGHRGVPGSDILTVPRLTFGILFACLASGSPLEAQTLLTERQAITKVFPRAHWFAADSLRPDSATRALLERVLGRPLYEPVYPVRRAWDEARGFLGYTLVTEERGKYRPITMLIGIDSARRVAGVQILVYREPRGGEVGREYFLRQYRGKAIGDPIRLNRDIINISGATISVQSVNTAVRKTLALITHYYSGGNRLPAPRSLRPLEEIP